MRFLHDRLNEVAHEIVASFNSLLMRFAPEEGVELERRYKLSILSS